MHVYDTKTALPSAAYLEIEGTARPIIPFGRIETGGLTGETWADLHAWLIAARRAVERQMRDTPVDSECPASHNGIHDWMLVESGYERFWYDPQIQVEGDHTEVRVDAAFSDAGWSEDCENQYLACRRCMGEANADTVDI